MSKAAVKTKKKESNLSHIIEPLRPFAVEITKLSFDDQNARIHSERNIKTIEKSLEQYGQRAPIIVQKKGLIVRAGNGRLQAAINLGWTHIAAVVTDDADATAKAFALMDNKSAELAEWDMSRLSLMLSEINSDDLDLTFTGFDSEEFSNLLVGFGTDSHSASTGEFQVVDAHTQDTQYQCPKCRYEWSGNAKATVKS